MWKILVVSGNGIQKITADTKKEAHKLIQWSKINTIQRLEDQTYLVRYKV